MEAIGGGYASGYQIGQRDRLAEDNQNASAWDRMYGNRTVQQGSGTGGFAAFGATGKSKSSLPSASDIRNKAIETALDRKAQEIEIDKQNLAKERMQIENEALRYQGDRKKQDDLGSDVEIATKRADELRQQNMKSADIDKNQMIDNAMKSLYMGDSEGFKQFFDKYGAPDVSVNGFEKQPDGTVKVIFNDDESEVFQNENDVVKKLLMPAAAIASGFARGGVDKPLDPEKMIKMRENAVNALLKQNRTMPTQEEVDQYMNLVNPKSLAAASSTASSPKDNTQPAIDVKKERRKINK